MAKKVVPLIREIAEEKKLKLIDIHDSINNLSLFDKDELHLNNEGHKIVANFFYDVIAYLFYDVNAKL